MQVLGVEIKRKDNIFYFDFLGKKYAKEFYKGIDLKEEHINHVLDIAKVTTNNLQKMGKDVI